MSQLAQFKSDMTHLFMNQVDVILEFKRFVWGTFTKHLNHSVACQNIFSVIKYSRFSQRLYFDEEIWTGAIKLFKKSIIKVVHLTYSTC